MTRQRGQPLPRLLCMSNAARADRRNLSRQSGCRAGAALNGATALTCSPDEDDLLAGLEFFPLKITLAPSLKLWWLPTTMRDRGMEGCVSAFGRDKFILIRAERSRVRRVVFRVS